MNTTATEFAVKDIRKLKKLEKLVLNRIIATRDGLVPNESYRRWPEKPGSVEDASIRDRASDGGAGGRDCRIFKGQSTDEGEAVTLARENRPRRGCQRA